MKSNIVESKKRLTTFKPLSPSGFRNGSGDSPPDCPTPDYYSDNSLTDQSIETSHIVKSSILKFEEKNKQLHNPVQKTVTFGQNSTKEITPIKNLVRSTKNSVSSNGNVAILKSEKKSQQDLIEMQSIESYDLTEPKPVAPKPPPTYFQPPNRNDLNDGGKAQAEMKKRTTVIKITEYPTEKRREPGKFDFIKRNNENEKAFETELASTLSRSNLRNKTDAFANSAIIKNGNEKSGSNVGRFNGFHPTPVIPTENQISDIKKTLKTFERNNASNTIVVKIPKRN